ncbi:HNH endonuclease [Clostridium thermosuccinogenes]|uniref:Putative HNH nuclease YajD n=1 Tax=Clostridium thermosuccinogenes TaxID=84032 RepID=A0A2K2FGD6_9CLOT|nr:HNH endonuclease signature motif containing protein [Pseudoclostridium thermosuccinogenes]AUS97361.1 HNH endonuclease [Pseudoclostridium thermosuccinogenes]PNT93699.1 HNH endonuclease [Pseudoclostridium thermosuccinogenes]PNT96169.1 HNH endonuclease [Pseudoclostridium thermosuccinogenes]PNT97843.1 HNH endonuclease [Pseudoclostridium thermosuccinogenes]
MTKKPKRPCSYPGCAELTDGRYCEKHQKQADSYYNKYERDPQTRKRYGRTWKRIRDRYISEHPLCQECQKYGRLTPAEEVHHIIPLSKGGTNADSNLMSLCKQCHSSITAREGERWARR